MDNLIFEKIWKDDSCNLLEIKVTAKSKNANVYNELYIVQEEIVDLENKLLAFLKDKNNKFIWETANEPKISLNFSHNDNLGHVTIEFYMDLYDSGFPSKNNCYFPIETEIGLLDNFFNGLKNFNTSDVEYAVKLVD